MTQHGSTTHAISRLREKQQHLLAEAQKCDAAIQLLLDIEKQEHRATKLIAKLQPASPPPEQVTYYAQLKAGRRPIDRIRQLLAGGSETALTPDVIATRTGLPPHTVHIVLPQLRRRKEVRHTRQGWIGTKVATPVSLTPAYFRQKQAQYDKQKAKGARPVDRLRALFASANGTAVPTAALAKRIGAKQKPVRLALSWMSRKGEVEQTPDGWVARRP